MNRGDIVLQYAKSDLSSMLISAHSLLMLQKPRFVHAGIYIADGKMITAELLTGVAMQEIQPEHDVAVPYVWQDFERTSAWLQKQIGKPYDCAAWALCAVERVDLGVSHYLNTGKRYMCSTIVGCAMRYDRPELDAALSCRCFTPNDLGRYLGIA